MTGLSSSINCKRVIRASDISIIFFLSTNRQVFTTSVLTVLQCLFHHLETISAEVSPNISVLGLKCPDHFGISSEVSRDTLLDTSALVLKWFDTEVS